MTHSEFIDAKEINQWCSHRHVLWLALNAIRKMNLPVLELGAGSGSTPYLKQYCQFNGLEFMSYETDKIWADKMGVNFIESWEDLDWRKEHALAFIDHAPGDHRRVALSRLHHVKICVIHDSETPGWNASDYKVRPEIAKFRYCYDMIPKENQGAWTTAISNFIDVSKWSV